MKVSEAIRMADELAPNDISQETKLYWLNQIEGRVQEEVLHFAHCERFEYDETKLDWVMLADPPYDDIYYRYLICQIHAAEEEEERYNAEAARYNDSWAKFNKHMMLNYRPSDWRPNNV